MRGLGPFSIPKMPSGCSSCISCRFQPLSTTYGQIAHVLLTRSPLGLRKQASFRLVRLACIRHAASVHPEPGSNSPFAHFVYAFASFSFLRSFYSVFIGIDVSCSVFKDRPPRGLSRSALVYITILSLLSQHFFSLFYSKFVHILFSYIVFLKKREDLLLPQRISSAQASSAQHKHAASRSHDHRCIDSAQITD